MFSFAKFRYFGFPSLRMGKTNVNLYEIPTNAHVRDMKQRNKHR